MLRMQMPSRALVTTLVTIEGVETMYPLPHPAHEQKGKEIGRAVGKQTGRGSRNDYPLGCGSKVEMTFFGKGIQSPHMFQDSGIDVLTPHARDSQEFHHDAQNSEFRMGHPGCLQHGNNGLQGTHALGTPIDLGLAQIVVCLGIREVDPIDHDHGAAEFGLNVFQHGDAVSPLGDGGGPEVRFSPTQTTGATRLVNAQSAFPHEEAAELGDPQRVKGLTADVFEHTCHLPHNRSMVSSVPRTGPSPQVTDCKDIYDEVVSGVGTYPIPEGETARVFKEGFKGMIANAQIYEDGNITIDSGDDAKGGVFARDGIVLVEGRNLRTLTRPEPGIGGGATSMWIYDEFAFAERSAGNWLYEVFSDATSPTS